MVLDGYQNFISLGYFCNVAGDLEELGLRSESNPFDWNISDFQGIVELIDTEFADFMQYGNLYQSINNRSHYLDNKYKVFFFHDFSKYESLDSQYLHVKEKYTRRIVRFLKKIENPTVFIRYISDEIKNDNGRSKELEWIEENQACINAVIQKYNRKNTIIYIGNEEMTSEIVQIYHVKKDLGDVVSRHPIINNQELFPIIEKVHIDNQEKNIIRYNKKIRRKKSAVARLKNILGNIYYKLSIKEYIHDLVYDIPGK